MITTLGSCSILPEPRKCPSNSKEVVQGEDYSYCNLKDFDLSNKSLDKASFNHSVLDNVNLHNSSIVGVDLSYSSLKNANLEFTNARLANLSYANLETANLQNTNFSGADLSYANLDKAVGVPYLYGAKLSYTIDQSGKKCAEGSVGTCK